MIKILVDTNSLIYFFDNKTDLYSLFDRHFSEPFSFYTISPCLEELKRMGRKEVIKWADVSGIKTWEATNVGRVDDNILDIAKKEKLAVISEDRALVSRAKSAGIKVFKIGGMGISET